MQLRYRLVGVGIVLVTLLLAACGDPTATPIPATTAPATTAVAATTAATTAATATTTAAATTAPATTAPATTTTTATTSAAATTLPAQTLALPSIAGLKEVEVDATLKAELGKQLPPLPNFVIKLYVSDDTSDNVSTTLDKALTDTGYQFAIPGATKPTKQGEAYSGLYTKAGALDLLTAVGAVPDNSADLSGSSMNQAVAQKLYDQLKGKKTLVFVVGANDILKAMAASRTGNATQTATVAVATTTSAATPSVSAAVSTGGGTVSEADIPVYSGAKKIDALSTNAGGIISVYYLSQDEADKIVGWAKQALADKGWQALTTTEVGGATFVKGTKGNYQVSTTILGAKARGNPNYDPIFKVAAAGANDSVIFTIISKA